MNTNSIIGTVPPIGGDSTAAAPDLNIRKWLSGKEYLYPPTQGPESVLDPLPVDRAVKADAWDAFHGSDTPENLKANLDALTSLPQSAKADLFDLKFGVLPATGTTGPVGHPQSEPVIPPTGVTGPVGLSAEQNILPGSRQNMGNGRYKFTTLEPPPVPGPSLPAALRTAPVSPPLSQADLHAASARLAATPPGPEYASLNTVRPKGAPAPASLPVPELPRELQGGPLDPRFQGPRLPGKEPGPGDFAEAAFRNHPVATGINAALNLDPVGVLPGLAKAAQGAYRAAAPSSTMRERAGGLGDVIGGAMEAATPLLPEQLLTNPLQTIKVVGAAVIAGHATTAGLTHLGVAPEYAYLAGDIAAIVAGYGVHWASAPPEIRALVAAAQQAGPNGDPTIDADLIDKLTRMASQHEQSPYEAQIAREMLRGKYGIDIPEPPVTADHVPMTEESETGQAPPAPPKPKPVVNTDAFTKAHALWHKTTTDAAAKFMQDNPGVSWDQALEAISGTTGLEPQISDFAAPPEPPEAPAPPKPAKPEKPVRPARVATPTPGITPNLPTAAQPTAPESPATIALQMQQLVAGQRKAVMFPQMQGEPPLGTWPLGIRRAVDKFGNSYAYHPALITSGDIHRAAESNTLPEVLGHASLGMGAPDKSVIQGTPIAVAGHATDGTEAQTTATDAEHLPQTVVATRALTPPGGIVEVKPVQQAAVERQDSAPALPGATPQRLLGAPEPDPSVMGAVAPIGGETPQETFKKLDQEMAATTQQLNQMPVGTRFTLVLPGIGSLNGIWEMTEVAGDKFWRNTQTGLHKGSGEFGLYGQTINDTLRWNAPALAPSAPVSPAPTATPQPAPAAPQPAAAAPPSGLGAATDKSVRDLPVRATVKDGKINVVVRMNRKPVVSFSFPLEEWAATEQHPNPNYPQRQLAEAKLAGTNIADVVDRAGEKNERMNGGVVNRLADSVAGAVRQAVKGARANVQSDATDQIPGAPGTAGEAPAGALSPVPEGHGPEPVRGLPGQSGSAPVHGEPRPDTGSEGQGVRRITGTADIPETPAGDRQMEDLAEKTMVAPFDAILAADNTRTQEAASRFGQVTGILRSLNGWPRASFEGQPAHEVKAQMAHYIANPDEVPPGVSPISGEPGQSWNQMKVPLLTDLVNVIQSAGPESRVLIVTSGGNLQVIDAWAKAGYPMDFDFDRSDLIAQPYWSVTGKMFRLGDGLEQAENNAEPGIYLTEHGETLFNQRSPEGVASKSETATEPAPGAPTGLEGGSRADAVREGSTEALAGVPPENVPGTAGAGPTLQAGDVSGNTHGADDGKPLEGGDTVRPGEGTGVPTVVSSPGRKGSAESDLRSVPTPDTGSDYRLTPEEAAQIENGTARVKAKNNLEAIRTIKKIQAEGDRPATLEEKSAMAKYVGWGDSELAQGIFKGRREWAGIRQELQDLLTPEEFKAAEESTINAHYTRRDLAAAMWDALARMGFKTGTSMIEPGMGIGNFFMMMPEGLQKGTRRYGVELDLLTGAMAKALYPGSNVIIKPYQETSLPDGYFDAAIGNVPFQGGINIYDPVFRRQPYLTQTLHNYFFSKTMQKLRPGGVMLMITSRGSMDSTEPTAKAFREWMTQQGELLGAIRLPRDTFKSNAGTAVTADVIAIRKRVPGEDPISTETWIQSTPFDMGDGQTVDMNEYFQRHPEMMMGKMQPGSMYHKGYPELFGTFSLDHFKDLLQSLPSDVIPSWTAPPEQRGNLADTYPEAGFIKDGGYAIVNGQLIRREGPYLQPQTGLSPLRLLRAKGLIDIRGAAREVLRTQDMDAPEPIILAARRHLNDVYDKFINTKIGRVKGEDKTFGPINSYSNVLALGQDPDWPLLSALEKWDKNTKTATKTDIFTTRTKVKPKPVESADTGAEALAVSLNELGRLDWDRMQQLTGRTPEELISELQGKIFRNPVTKRWETADEYLSGNVRQKLADAEFAAKSHPEYAGNVEALKVIQPKDLTPGDIDATLGATWIPANLYAKYANELLNAEGGTVKLVPLTGGYAVQRPHYFSDQGVANKIEFGTPYFDGMDLFEMALNGISPVARDEVTDFNGNSKLVKNPTATIEAVEKQRRIMNDFSTWLWKDPARATQMATKYNLERNNLRLREYDGSHLTFPGLNRTWLRNQDLDAHQKNAIWRIIQSGNTLLAHAVGAGKTLEMVVAAMEMKRLGLMRKPMIVVPNHLVGQWRDAFLQAYPAAQILVPTKNSFTAKKRARLMSQVATGNFDAIIVGHKSFELLPVKDETFQDFMDEQIAEVEKAIEAAREGKTDNEAFKDPTTKQLVRRKKQLEERLKKRTNRAAKDVTVTFEELGVDGLFVDEAHAYKNLGYMTMMDRIAGLPNTDAGRSVDMLLKSQYINNMHGNNRGLVFATGTPVSNSLAEIWTMMRYLMPQYLKDEGFDQFDAWAKTFGTKTTDMEVAPEGNRMISRTRFADFVNAPELMSMFRIVADVRTKEQLNLPTPAILGGGETDVAAEPSRALKNYISLLGDRADKVRSGAVKPDEDNMLKISSDGRKASLDMRLVDPTAKEDRNSKAHAAIRNIIKLYKEFDEHKATQLVFLDLSTPKAAEGKKKKSPVVNVDAPPSEQEEEAPAPAIINAGVEEAEPEEELDLYGEKEEAEQPEDTDTEEEKQQRFTVYSQIRKNLIAGGIPENEIAFIHDANTDAKKIKLFDQMNEGSVRVLLGSTEKMGAGMNVQKRLLAIHHLDAPWRPSDWEQRNGRIDRQGNDLWDKHQIPVRIFRYLTEGSFDAFMWQTIVAKARPITRFMNGDPSVRRVQEPAVSVMSAEQAMAVSSGNPEVREKIILDQDIGRIEILRGAWMNEQANIAQQLATVPGSIQASEGLNRALKNDIATRDADEALKVAGKEFKGAEIRKEGAAALVDVLKKVGPIGELQPIDASYRGFKLAATPQTTDISAYQTEDKERLFTVEKLPDGLLYSEVENRSPVKTGIGYMRAALELRPLSKKEAEGVHAMIPTGLVVKPGQLKYWGSIGVLTNPNLRMIAESHNYPAVVNYESPGGTIASADHQIRSFEEDLANSQANLRRLEKQKVELESKQGQPFRDEEKLVKMLRRQRELAEKLGENKDDAQALAALEDEDNPLAQVMADPTSAMLPEWFPSKKVYVVTGYGGQRASEKVNVINKYLGVYPQKTGRTTRYSIVHLPTGKSMISFAAPVDAVAFARQAFTGRDWNFDQTSEDLRKWASDFEDEKLQLPTETPKESVERLVKKEEPETPEQRSGPITAYKPFKRKLPVPEYTKGEKGWMKVALDGKDYAVSSTYIIQGDAAPAARSTPVKPEQVRKFINGQGAEKPIKPVAFSTSNIDGKDNRVIWFSNEKPIDGRYYEDILKRYPGATFQGGEKTGHIYINNKTGHRVGVVLMVKPPEMPAAVKSLMPPKPPERRSPPPLKRPPPYMKNMIAKNMPPPSAFMGVPTPLA